MENINNYEERLSLLDPEQRAHWELTGSLEDSEAKTPPVEETTSRSDDDQNDPHVYQSGTTAAEPVEATDGEWLQDAIQKHPDLVVSTVALDQMLNTRQNGGALVDYLSSHKDEAEELVRETGLGIETWEDYLHVVEAAQTNPELLAQLVRAHTLAEIRLDQIEKNSARIQARWPERFDQEISTPTADSQTSETSIALNEATRKLLVQFERPFRAEILNFMRSSRIKKMPSVVSTGGSENGR